MGSPSTPFHHLENKLTKHKKVYGLEKVMFDTHVTYFTPELRELYVDEYANIFDLSEPEKEAMLAQEIKDAQEYDDFYIAHFASERGYQNINEQSETKRIWAIRLDDVGSELRPLSIEPLRRSEQQQYFFPHMDGFSKLYKVRFRKTTSQEKHLVMTSPARTIEFDWNF